MGLQKNYITYGGNYLVHELRRQEDGVTWQSHPLVEEAMFVAYPNIGSPKYITNVPPAFCPGDHVIDKTGAPRIVAWVELHYDRYTYVCRDAYLHPALSARFMLYETDIAKSCKRFI